MQYIIFIVIATYCITANSLSSDAPNLEIQSKNTLTWEEWINQTKTDLKKKNIYSDSVLNYLGKLSFNKKVVQLDRKQPEFKITFNDYLKNTISKKRISEINKKSNKYRDLLDKIKLKYKVDSKILLSLWGIESSFGKHTGKFDILRSLASLAYDGRRRDFFVKELQNALIILENNHVDKKSFQGSWAGAFGQTQFMPSTFIKYAVDFDRDNKIDLFSQPDALASGANYLHSEGWDNKLIWGEKVNISIGREFRNLSEKKIYKSKTYWEKNGINFKKKYNDNDQLRLVIPDSVDNQYFLVTKNFDVILKWNRSNYFALTVFLLSDEVIF